MLLCKWCCIHEQINLTSDSSVPNSVNTHKVILPITAPRLRTQLEIFAEKLDITLSMIYVCIFYRKSIQFSMIELTIHKLSNKAIAAEFQVN